MSTRAARLSLLPVVLMVGACSGEADLEDRFALLDTYCVDCHNSIDVTAGLVLESRDPASVHTEPEVWEAVVRKLRGRMMPPPGSVKPDTDEVDGLIAALEQALDSAAGEPDPGHVTLHRLNRTEYANAVLDLLALEIDVESLLPIDPAESGFDNVANALQVSPAFIDQYLAAARNLSAEAIGDAAPRPVGVPYNISSAGQEFHVPGLPLGTRGGALIEHHFPADGEYLLNIGDLVTGLWGYNQEHRNTLIATLDGVRFFELDIGGGEDLRALDQIGAPAVDAINARLKNIAFTTTAGVHRLGVTFLHRSFAESDRQMRSLVPGRGQDAVLKLGQIEIFGPITPTGLGSTPSRDAILSCYPEAPADERGCARTILDRLTARAFRGLATGDDVTRLLALYDQGSAEGGFEEGVQYALSGVLAHPKFLYRIEELPEDAAPGEAWALSAVELASRLSFFLWSTIPDAELLATANSGELLDPDVLERQVRRLLADPRSEFLASNFAFQWLELGGLDAVAPDTEVFADVDRNIRRHLATETTLFVDSIFRADRSVLDLLDANHTFVNETLALHYGINDVRGTRFRRIELEDPNRWGLLGKGAVLMTASYPNRTSPVLRGSWLLENVFGTPPADPPPNVEGLVENIAGQAATSVRARLEAHRTNPSCNGCHGVIDPLGFALENFDAVGRWRFRDRESGDGIDASGVLADGRVVDGPITLREEILKRPEQFLQTFTEKLMTYAVGRSLTYRDMPAIRRIVREAADADYRFSSFVLGVVASPQFRMQRMLDPVGNYEDG